MTTLAARQRGVGRQLLRAVEDAARGQAVTRLRMDTRGDLAEARHLYATNGYREVPRSTTVVSLITGTE